MKTALKTTIAFLLLSAIACVKESSKISSVSQTNNTSDAVAALQIGQSYHGGIIFYIDNTGKHGLVVSKVDLSTQIAWTAGAKAVTGATGVAVGTGASNTQLIVNAQGHTTSYAALLCHSYQKGDYADWYLPSKDELDLLYQQKGILGISAGDYWSSSEVSQGKAWEQEFGGGFKFKNSKSFTLHVRAISSF